MRRRAAQTIACLAGSQVAELGGHVFGACDSAQARRADRQACQRPIVKWIALCWHLSCAFDSRCAAQCRSLGCAPCIRRTAGSTGGGFGAHTARPAHVRDTGVNAQRWGSFIWVDASPAISRSGAHGFPVWRERAAADWPTVACKNLYSSNSISAGVLALPIQEHAPACTSHPRRSKAMRYSPQSQPGEPSRVGAIAASRRLRLGLLRCAAEHHPQQTYA